jgi:AAA domain-containing protein
MAPYFRRVRGVRLEGFGNNPASVARQMVYAPSSTAAQTAEGNQNSSLEEADVIHNIVDRLIRPEARWIDGEGVERALAPTDILIIAPYNSQVSRLIERIGSDSARIGTVDKFQGQEAPVAIYSMATSVPEDAPRGM